MKDEVILEGIVLKVSPYKEKDGLVTVYFKEYGQLPLLDSGIYKRIYLYFKSGLM